MTKNRRKDARKSKVRVSRRGTRRVGRRKADRVTPSGGATSAESDGRYAFSVDSTILGAGSKLIDDPPSKPKKYSIFEPPPGQMVVIMTVPGGKPYTLWYIGPARECEYNTSAVPFLSWGDVSPKYVAEAPEITIRGFVPTLSGKEPLKSKRWPTPPAPPKPPKVKTLLEYTRAELADAIDKVASRLQDLNRDAGEGTIDHEDDELAGARKWFAELMTELKRRFGPRVSK